MIHRAEPQEEPTESRKMSKHAERQDETKRLAILMARVKRQLATLQSVPPPRAA